MIDWFPTIVFGLYNGWLYFIIYLIVFGTTLRTCSPEVRTRLYDKSLWTKRTRGLVTIGKIFSFLNIILIIFAALVYPNIEFFVGTFIYIVGLSLLVGSIIHFRKAPLDNPITEGVYKYSRNPQMIGIFVLFFGMVLVIGSIVNLVFLVISIVFNHFAVLGEEAALEQQYGESYLEYKNKIPR
jgi:protein-S-isoprenylcysteine O-methyltransferase Ste14